MWALVSWISPPMPLENCWAGAVSDVARKRAEDGDGGGRVLEGGGVDGAGVQEDGAWDDGDAEGFAEHGGRFDGCFDVDEAVEAGGSAAVAGGAGAADPGAVGGFEGGEVAFGLLALRVVAGGYGAAGIVGAAEGRNILGGEVGVCGRYAEGGSGADGGVGLRAEGLRDAGVAERRGRVWARCPGAVRWCRSWRDDGCCAERSRCRCPAGGTAGRCCRRPAGAGV